MKKALLLPLALALLPVGPRSGQADSTYFPYQTIDSYFNQPPASPSQPAPGPPAPGQPPAQQPAPEERLKAAPQAEPTLVPAQAPEFLFPKELGFGVAVGVPYDMVYVSGAYYYWRGGAWNRAISYRGPWSPLEPTRLPPELRRHKLAEIRAARSREFKSYWTNKDQYRGKLFRPSETPRPPQAGSRAQPEPAVK